MIKTLQRRMTTIGRIRIGDSVPAISRGGKEYRRPRKLDHFRLTSSDKLLLEHAAKEYGGTVEPWEPQGGGPKVWSVHTTADRLPIVVPPQGSVSQWFEEWEGRRCVRRCDGEVETLSGRGCPCAATQNQTCKPTTRLKVLLKDLPGAGQWLLVSHGYNAAAELPGYAELLGAVGGYVDADLRVEERMSLLPDGTTTRYMVPVISVMSSPAELLAGKGTVQLGSPYRVRPVAELESEAVDVPQITHAQKQRMGRLMNMQGMSRDERRQFVCDIVERQMESSEELTEHEAETVLKALAVLPSPAQIWERFLDDALPDDWSVAEVEAAFRRDHDGRAPQEVPVAHIRAWGELMANGQVDHVESAA
ncbi:hypothetical protein [Nocardiopsis synnemataformans]|uniref:recombination directionality factor n=1 Tax=Nocardiopsis synnemataformans TaxID=61305 RepID=UPI003EB905BE